eukprot:1424280-Pyramimonas_sp.AAC.1
MRRACRLPAAPQAAGSSGPNDDWQGKSRDRLAASSRRQICQLIARHLPKRVYAASGMPWL